MELLPVLVRTLYGGNAGSVVRIAANLGIDEIVLVSPAFAPGDHELRQMAVGALDRVRLRPGDDLLDAVSGCDLVVATTSGRQRDPRGVHAPDDVRMLIERQAPARVAVVFGPERSGLSSAELRRCQVLCSIPANPEFPVLNLAQAAAILLTALAPVRATAAPPRSEPDLPADAREFDAALAHLRDVLLMTGFLDPDNPERIPDQLRRWLGRSVPTRRELAILRGIAAHVAYIWGRSSSER